MGSNFHGVQIFVDFVGYLHPRKFYFALLALIFGASRNRFEQRGSSNKDALKFGASRIVITKRQQLKLTLARGLSRQNRSPQKSVRPDRFWQKNLPKVVPPDHFCCQNRSGRTNFGCQNWSPLANFGPPGGSILARSYLPKSVPQFTISYTTL